MVDLTGPRRAPLELAYGEFLLGSCRMEAGGSFVGLETLSDGQEEAPVSVEHIIFGLLMVFAVGAIVYLNLRGRNQSGSGPKA